MLPRSIGKTGEEYLAVNYAGFAPLLVEGLKAVEEIMSRHREELDELRARLEVRKPALSRCSCAGSRTVFRTAFVGGRRAICAVSPR